MKIVFNDGVSWEMFGMAMRSMRFSLGLDEAQMAEHINKYRKPSDSQWTEATIKRAEAGRHALTVGQLMTLDRAVRDDASAFCAEIERLANAVLDYTPDPVVPQHLY